MPNENLNDFHWKNKLEDVAGLAGESLTDTEASWQKLHSRLKQKPRRRLKAAWYWAAASIVLLAISLPWITANKKPDSLVKNETVQIESRKETIVKVLPSPEKVAPNIFSSSIEIKKIIKPTIQTRIKKYPAPVQKKEATAGNFVDQNDIRQQPLFSTPVTDSFAETKLAIAPVQRKLKVVHINELGGPDEEMRATARYNEPHSFKLKIINQGAYTNPPLSSNYTGFNIFNTKISPSN